MDFETRKRASLLQVLFKVARLTNEEAIRRVRARTGRDDFRLAHTSLFPHITFDGVRLTDLADRVGSTKQAVLHLVNELAEMGVVERIPDPLDGRAKLIRFTAAGARGLEDGLAVLAEIEQELTTLVGAEQLGTTHDALLAILDSFE